MKLLTMAAGALLAALAATWADAREQLPKGYQKWEKSRQKMVTDQTSLFYGSHYVYVDKKAMPVYKAGEGIYPEGSRFVVVNHDLRKEGGKLVEGKKNMVVYMEKNRKHGKTGGWLFAGFTPEGKPSGLDPVKNCFECHEKEAKDRDYVISKYKDFR